MKYILLLVYSLCFGQEELIIEHHLIFPDEIIETSIDSILLDVNKFHNKTVKISGYLNTQFEGSKIYIDSVDYDFRNIERSIAVNMTTTTFPKYTRKKYTSIIGKFRAFEDKPSSSQIYLFKAEIYKTFVSNASKDICIEIKKIEKSITNKAILNQKNIEFLECFSGIKIRKKKKMYYPTIKEVNKLKVWYNENKYNISPYIYEDNFVYLLNKKGVYVKGKCNMLKIKT